MRDLVRIHIDDADGIEFASGETDSLADIYYRHTGKTVYKWHHYLELYDRYLKRYRGQPVRVLELGVMAGGSLQLWRSYFGADAVIHGIDLNPVPLDCGQDGVVTHLGSQTDAELLAEVVDDMGGVDVVIDDGSHIGRDQIKSFNILYPLVDPDGIYICEDTRACYWSRFDGGLARPGTFVEFTKELIDRLHAWYVEDETFASDETIARSTFGISIHDSMIVIEKRAKEPPIQVLVGDRPK